MSVKLAHDEVIDLKETFRGKPSDALEYMCDGLLRQDKRKGFKVTMWTYGGADEQVCFGCAATSTIQEIAGRNLTASNILNRQLIGFDSRELNEFELVIDAARKGFLRLLFDFCEITEVRYREWGNWSMRDHNWKSCIPKVRKAIREMRAKGI